MDRSRNGRIAETRYGEGITNPRARQRALCIAATPGEPDLTELRELLRTAGVAVAGWDAPYGGSRDSGVGARNAREGILKYTEPHTIMITRLGPRKDLGWLPNSKRITKLLERAFSRYYSR